MSKEIEMLKELLEKIEKISNFDVDKKINEEMEKGFKLCLEKEENNTAKCHIEGSNLGILIGLATLENQVINKLKPPKGLYEYVKKIVGVEEVI